VKEYEKKGKLVRSNGALGSDLSQFGLGFCMVLKSNGSGLYATKDLALAIRKFEKFKINKSIYVVDAAQTLHFKQVFKTLELLGFDDARRCYHLPYGLVVLPDGKMSSRKGNVIYFATLVEMLNQQIDRDYLSKYVGKWEPKELEEARHAIAVATIKYGMLNHDTAKDIVFDIKEWTAKSGNTGPYLMYAYARTRSIAREVIAPSHAKVDFSLLTHPTERTALTIMHNFWYSVQTALQKNNPSGLCDYVYELSKSLSNWYESVSCKNAETVDLMATRLAFLQALGLLLKTGLALLGIQVIERM